MLARLAVPFRDASAAQLVWELDADPQPCLARASATLDDGFRLELLLLGASHQVLVADLGGRPLFSELVACRPGTPGALPASASVRRGGVAYDFRSTVEVLDAAGVADRAGDLRRRAGEHGSDRFLLGAFPGSPHALTGIEATVDGWRTWHVYPQSGEVVTTSTTVAMAGASA